MQKYWPWFVLTVAVAVSVYLFVDGRLRSTRNKALVIAPSEMAPIEDFDKIPPTGADMDLEAMDVSFSNDVNRTKGKVK